MTKLNLNALCAAMLCTIAGAASAASSTVPPATEDIGQAAIDYNISVVRDTQMQIEAQARAKAEAESQQAAEAQKAREAAENKARVERAKADRVRAEQNRAAAKAKAEKAAKLEKYEDEARQLELELRRLDVEARRAEVDQLHRAFRLPELYAQLFRQLL